VRRRDFISLAGLGAAYISCFGFPKLPVDDAVWINRMLRDGRTTLYLHQGIYQIGSSIILPDRVRLVGAGSGKTILTWSGPDDGSPMIRVPFPSSENGLSHFTVNRTIEHG